MEDTLQEITLKMDQKAIDFLVDDVRKKRSTGQATSLSDSFLIRLCDALQGKKKAQIFKLKENKPVIKDTLGVLKK